MTRNAPRQPMVSAATARGVVANSTPAPPTTYTMPLSRANRSGGYHLEIVTSIPMRPAAQPAPMRARPRVSPKTPSAIENTAEPPAAITNSPDMVRRGPNRSSNTPVGTCMRPNARKNAPVITPIASDEMARVRISSGAMTALETRKNWLATNPAQSTASMRVAIHD